MKDTSHGNNVAKHHYAFLRTRIFDVLSAAALATQYCAKGGRGVDLASLALRAFTGACKFRQRTAIILFADIKSAYYTVCRQMVLAMDTSAQDLDDIFPQQL